MCRGVDDLVRIIGFQFQLDPYDKNTLFLFCGKRTDCIKGLIWEVDGTVIFFNEAEVVCDLNAAESDDLELKFPK